MLRDMTARRIAAIVWFFLALFVLLPALLYFLPALVDGSNR